MKTLQEQYKNDKPLLHLYEKKLLIPGWAGQLDDAEAVYVANALNSDRALWLQWRRAGHFKGMHRHVTPDNAKRLTLALAGNGIDENRQTSFLSKRIMKQAGDSKTMPPSPANNFETSINAQNSTNDRTTTGPGRPRATGELSRSTLWRRQKEQMAAAI